MAGIHKDYNEPQEDDDLEGKSFEIDKMNPNTNGSTSNGQNKRNRYNDIGNQLRQAKSAIYTNRHYQLHALSLFIILILGIVLIVIGIQFLIFSLRKPEVVCETSQCLLSSSQVLSNLNRSIDPCTDFFEFSCREWIQSKPLTDSQGFYSTKQQVMNKIYFDLRHYLDQVLPSPLTDDAYYKVKQFYKSCMDLEDIDYVSQNYFEHEIQKAGGWNIIGNWNSQNWDQSVVVERLHTIYGVNPFFKISVGADDLDPQLPYIIKIFPAGLGLPSRNYYFDPKFKNIVNAYKQYLSETVKIFGGTKLDSSQFAENTFNYEKRIAEITPDKSDYLKPNNVFKRRYSIRELKLSAPSIKWDKVLQNYFQKARLNDNTRVLLAFDTYFRNISNIISTTDNKGLNDYLIWKMISAYMPYLSKEFRIIHSNFNQALYGLPPTNSIHDENRWKFCLETTSKFFGYALSSLYVNNQISEISNITVSSKIDIINSIRDTILRTPQTFIWSKDESSKQLISMKIKQMENFVGQPMFVLKRNLAHYYNEFLIGIKFLENIFEAINHSHKKMEMLLNEKNVDFAWPLLPHDVDLAYDYAGNKLFTPFGILQDPFYNPNELYAQQFGSLGFHVGSHMLKAFDLIGLNYGLPDGRLSNNRTLLENNDLQFGLSCLRDELDQHPFKINDTISQTYIDIGALKMAWESYQNYITRKNKEAVLPGLNYNNDQLFFISFAQSMCSNSRPETLLLLSETSNQLPDSIRVNTLVRQSKTFSQVFDCQPPDPVKGPVVCHLWN